MAKKPSEGSQPKTAGMNIVVSADGKAYQIRNRVALAAAEPPTTSRSVTLPTPASSSRTASPDCLLADRGDGLDIQGLPGQPPWFAELRNTLNTVPAYTWYSLPHGTLTFVNERYADYLGLPKDHPLRSGVETGVPWDTHLQLLHPDDHEETRRVGETILRTGSAGQGTFRIRNGQGGYRWFVSRVEPLRASDGTLLCFIGINLDIEERKQAEFYLAEGQRLAHMGSWAFNASGFEYWSPELFRIHGLDPGGRAPTISEYMALVHPDDREFIAQAIKKMLADHSGFDFTKRIVRPDGTIRHIRCVGTPATKGGMFQEFVGTGIDVTEEELLARALRKSEEELRKILDLTPQLVAVLGPRRERLFVNRIALDYLGVTLDEWRQRLPAAEAHPEDLERLQSHWNRALPHGSDFEVELRMRKRDGSYRWFLARHNPVRDDQGQVIRWYVAATDIEDRKRAEEKLREENLALREEIKQASIYDEIVGSSGPIQKVLSQVRKVAPTESTVLILGETGTGKELIARAIHQHSKRAGLAFISVNCGAIPTSLVASELFGHEKGAFTGATQRRLGRFEAANGGTLFMDEVGDLPLDIQSALLRVLQEREIQRVGSDKPIPVDVRVLAATHRDLEKLVIEGKFRQDLLYRLNVVPIAIPSLRERAADIPVLVEYFIARFGKKTGKKFTAIEKKSLAVLKAYGWPGNVRELQNVIERAVILSESDIFEVDAAWLKRAPSAVPPTGVALDGLLSAHEREVIEAALAQCQGRISGPAGAAAKLGIPDSTLDAKIKRLGIDKYRFKSQMR